MSVAGTVRGGRLCRDGDHYGAHGVLPAMRVFNRLSIVWLFVVLVGCSSSQSGPPPPPMGSVALAEVPGQVPVNVVEIQAVGALIISKPGPLGPGRDNFIYLRAILVIGRGHSGTGPAPCKPFGSTV